MAQAINPPRGMRDFLPAEMTARNQLLATILDSYRSHGFQEIETPALESIERLTSGQGGDNEKLAFRVLKRGEELESAIGKDPDELADLGLRYDLTVPLTRFYASNHSKLPKILKAIQVGPVWRAERPQKGRYRQFLQCDIDIIGDDSFVAEIELLNASLSALSAIGLPDAKIRVNHRQLLAAAITGLGIAEAEMGKAMITIDKLDKLGLEGVAKELSERFGDQVAAKAKSWLGSLETGQSVPKELEQLFGVVESQHPNRLRFDPTLVRGMGYYTGTIFEIEHPGSGTSIGGGGRYDGMVGKWLGTNVPAVGISIGFERVAELITSRPQQNRNLVLVFDDGEVSNALDLQRQAIAAGYRVRLEIKPKKLNLLLESLKSQGFGHFVLVGSQETDFSALEIKPIG
jgi:histidyl-tRNA synthetase